MSSSDASARLDGPEATRPAPTAAAFERAALQPARSPDERVLREAFLEWVARLVHDHRLALVGVARHEGLGPEDAFDAVQEAFQTFLTMPEARPLLEQPEESRKLLVAVTRNVARNRRRLHANARPHTSDPTVLEDLAADAAGVEDTIAAAEEHVRLAGCMLTLAEVPRTVVTLRMLDDLPGEDVARLLGVSPGHVAVLLHRAKARLLDCMSTCGDR
jgi:RNA polymerase sigma-70 factor (ECF subfamily)